MKSSEYIENERREYALYILQNRALPSIIDGLKTPARRLIWTAKDGKKWKTASLAGAAMKLHPHGEASSVVNTLTSEYINNIPLFQGYGAFGTLLDTTAYGAARYTSVQLSEFAKEILFCDNELIPMIDNYDGTCKEPAHFLPLVPIVLLNPCEGIAIGFSCNILPRRLNDIIDFQIRLLKNENARFKPIAPVFDSYEITATESLTKEDTWILEGELNGKTIVKVYPGLNHDKLISQLNKLIDEGYLKDYIDDSKAKFEIKLIPTNNFPTDYDKQLSLLGLVKNQKEIINIIDFDQQKVKNSSVRDLIYDFTKWRLQFFEKRYKLQKKQHEEKLSKVMDIIIVSKTDVGKLINNNKTQTEFKAALKKLGVRDVDYIASLPISQLLHSSVEKYLKQKRDLDEKIEFCGKIIENTDLQVQQYIKELKQIRNKYEKL